VLKCAYLRFSIPVVCYACPNPHMIGQDKQLLPFRKVLF
jgi:hypothetical protein